MGVSRWFSINDLLKFVKIVGVQEIAQYIRAINNKNNKTMNTNQYAVIEQMCSHYVVICPTTRIVFDRCNTERKAKNRLQKFLKAAGQA